MSPLCRAAWRLAIKRFKDGLIQRGPEVCTYLWSEKNCMQVNLTKTWELLLRGKTTRTPPKPLEIIGRKEKLKLLGVTFEQVPVNWDTHIDYLPSKASSRFYILRICKYYGYTTENLDLLFQSLILSVFVYVTFHGKTYTNDWPLNGMKLTDG